MKRVLFGSERKRTYAAVLSLLLIGSGVYYSQYAHAESNWFRFASSKKAQKNQVKLYWLTADGLRADADLFNMYKWAQEGKLPNIKRLMERGAYGYSTPEFPTLTSNNIATLHTGATSKVHGIVEGAIRLEGHPLGQAAINGFNSTAKNVAPSWAILEKAGKKTVVLSVPGSTPPELTQGVTIRGRWGNWGFDAPAVIFEPTSNYEMRKNTVEDFYFNFLDKNLTRFVETSPATGWAEAAESHSKPIQTSFEAHGSVLHAYIYDSTNDGRVNYDSVQLSTDKSSVLTNLREGQWSDWFPLSLSYEGHVVASQAKVRVIKIWPDGRFRIRVLYNSLNNYLVQPASISDELTRKVGPMVDFLDNCLCLGMAPQLIVEPEDKTVALEEARMSWNWHKDAVGYILENWKPDVLIEDFYTPNQMLVSRWWLGDIDPRRKGYSPAKAKESWKDILEMYQGVDAIIGQALDKADENTLIVLSAQHGTAPLYRNTRLNNLFAKKGWLKFTIDPKTRKPTIDWKNSKVVYLKMAHVYINPNGLDGNYKRASGPAYEALRKEVIAELKNLKDSNGVTPVSRIEGWENADALGLPTDRIGDLVLESTTGYRMWEEVTDDKVVFVTPRATGYKEGVNPQDASVQTPFLIAGPGVAKGVALSKPVRHIDQLPTILNLMKVSVPDYVEGRMIEEVRK
ncbi:MAG: alkaline phosphatase family protein [Bdellovibrionales bacterium]|nr:alkaline phosphatase family protein [Bdellovibrionales bacterium]